MLDDEPLLPLVDEPIGEIVASLQQAEPELAALVASPRRQLAFRTFSYVRVGLLLGQLLVDHDVRSDGGRTWVERLLDDPSHRDAVEREIRAVAREVACDPALAEDGARPDAGTRERLVRFARRSGR